VTLLTLAPTLTTPLGPCDPAAKLGFLSWGCPKIAPPSFESRSRTPGLVRQGVSAAPRAPFGMGKPLPVGPPSSWVLATSTVCSSSTLRPYCRSLPILGFTAFPPVTKRNSPRCSCRPPKLSLRRQRRVSSRIPVGPHHRLVRLRPVRSPANLAPSPFLPSSREDRSFLRLFARGPGPRGLAPSSGPLPVRPFPAGRARCSPGLGRFTRARGGTACTNKSALRQRPLREVASSV